MIKKKTNKKPKPIYDENGRWVEERGRIKGAIRRAFRLSPQMDEVIKAARVELPPALKKDGTPGKRPRVRFRCAICGKLFPNKTAKTTMIQVDHIEPAVPLWELEAEMTYDDLVRGIFCDKDNLQVVCSVPMKKNNNKPSCHKLKTDRENWIRKRFKTVFYGTDETLMALSVFNDQYDEYLVEKERKRKEKEERKRLRELKKKNKYNVLQKSLFIY